MALTALRVGVGIVLLAGSAGAGRRAFGVEDGAGRTFLLLDTRVVERAEGAGLVLGTVEKEARNPLFVEEKPWEVRFDNLYANVFLDGGVYRLWYSPFIIDEVTSATPLAARATERYAPKKREMGICYAESDDGVVWRKPELGIIEFDGSTANNLVMREAHGSGVFRDEREPDAARRYKAFMLGGVATSPDGLHWPERRACPEIEAAGDTHNNALWVEELGRYVGITRLWGDGQRIVGRTESRDFRTWTKAVEAFRGDPEQQAYAMPVFRYADVFLGLVMMFDVGEDTVDCELAWSSDTIHWERICPGAPLIPRGPDGAFDCGCIYAAAYPVVLDDEIRLYYGGSDGPHGNWRAGGLGLARLRPDGFAGMRPVNGGTATIVTKPVVCSGRRLLVSADGEGGSVRCGVIGEDGLGAEACQPIASDVSRGAVTWRDGGDLSGMIGKRVQLEFELRNATLYAFSFAD
ncbi:MAG: hypothetical protein JXR94_05755 [Candidatus Hydrogenedentes bacterium]|nr:hypothetical protein [Candidatus Hydrogenedentota bacterium]